MTVEDRRVSGGEEDGSTDRFPVGMRVLAVDDDPTCLKLLENLLRRCQYHGLTFFFSHYFLKLFFINFYAFFVGVISDFGVFLFLFLFLEIYDFDVF